MELQNDSNTADSNFDITSGISESEQRDILAEIENITAQNRLSLSEEQKNSPAQGKLQAKRGGIGFPLIVNITALLLIAGAVFLLYFFHNQNEVQIRNGRAGYSSTEQALIQEIRRETARELEEKENEIALIVSKLIGVDAELQELYSNNQELSEEQRAVELDLHRLQEEYRSSLGSLQNERSRILEASRVREAQLRAQLEERTSELAALSEQSHTALAAARTELERITGDAEKAASIEAHHGASYAAAAAHIRSGNFSAAADILAIMREFLNTPAFQNIRSIQQRKELYLTSIDILNEMIAEAEKNAAGPALTDKGDLADLEKAVTDLQTQNDDLNRTLAAYTSQGSDLNRRITEFETTISGLRTEAAAQQRTLNERDSAAAELRSQNAALTQTVTARENTITELRSQNAEQAASIEALNIQLANIRQTLQSLSQ